jgi:hypothetical protein
MPVPLDLEAQRPDSAREMGKHLPAEEDADPVGIEDFVVFLLLWRPHQPGEGFESPSSAGHERMEPDIQNAAPLQDVVSQPLRRQVRFSDTCFHGLSSPGGIP